MSKPVFYRNLLNIFIQYIINNNILSMIDMNYFISDLIKITLFVYIQTVDKNTCFYELETLIFVVFIVKHINFCCHTAKNYFRNSFID